MAEQAPRKTPKSLIQIALQDAGIAIVIATIASLLVSSIIALLVVYFSYDARMSEKQRILQFEMTKNLPKNWVPDDIKQAILRLNNQYPRDKYYLISDMPGTQTSLEVLTPNLKKTVEEVQNHKKPYFEKGYESQTIYGGIPLFLDTHCLQCHPKMKKGDYAGALVFESYQDDVLLNWPMVIGFAVLLYLVFVFVAVLVLIQVVQKRMVLPLRSISTRLASLRIEDEEASWQRSSHQILEIDEIDTQLFENIQDLKSVHEKLDMLSVTEHESGFFHESHFKETLIYEVFRAKRYGHGFSILLVRLNHVSAQDGVDSSAAEPVAYFAKVLKHEIRDADMPFRMGKKLFAVLSPNTGGSQVRTLVQRVKEKYESDTETYCYDIDLGYASFLEDSDNGKELIKMALERMNSARKSET